ncbi:MAG TPA: septal ring lytic transglycosylase RlpA family protein [Terracidiphilus sp.]|jgi:rare lipoprotein A|nr:septal ring lytic transglycosylase RlpA family protein [Terracidiphilus sp.]
MEIRRRSGVLCLMTPLRIWLLAGITSIAFAGVMITLATRTVQADVKLPQPAATVPPSVPANTMAPDTKTHTGLAARTRHLMKGLASWYGGDFNGRTTASGERFDMYAMTACHPTLPFGTLVRVVNQTNGRSVVVKITDRGDLAKGRIIDLSYGAAEKLAMTNAGLAPVVVDVIARGAKPNGGTN